MSLTRFLNNRIVLKGENDLAQLEGMNAYCATVILRCCTLNDFLTMSSEQRRQRFADLVGLERIVSLS